MTNKPYKLDEQLTERLLNAIKLGSYIEHACAYAGINSSTYRRWRSLAEDNLEPYKSLFEKIQQAEAETKTASGIIIPDTAKEKPQKGTVIAVGKGTKENPITVSVGDTILYGKYAGTELKYNESDYLIMKESDILAIIK